MFTFLRVTNLTCLCLLSSLCRWTAVTQLCHHGMIFVPIGYTFGAGMFKMDSIRGGSPYGAGVFAGDGTRQPSEMELDLAEHQGKYMASIVKRLALTWTLPNWLPVFYIEFVQWFVSYATFSCAVCWVYMISWTISYWITFACIGPDCFCL